MDKAEDQGNSSNSKNLQSGKRNVRGRGRGRPRKTQNFHRDRDSSESRSRSRDNRPRGNSEERPSEEREQSSSEENVNANSFEVPRYGANNQEFAEAVRIAFIIYFSKIQQGKGMVFTSQQRKKLIKEEEKNKKNKGSWPSINWRPHSQWNQKTQTQKISMLFNSTDISLPSNVMRDLTIIFKKSSYIFADEVTCELYYLLLHIVKICRAADQQRASLINQLTQKIINGQDFKFFNFKFSPLFKLKVNEAIARQAKQWLLKSLIQIFERKIHNQQSQP